MANKTTNYGLTKPLPEEFYDINVHNQNMDKIDEELKKRPELNEDGKIPSEQLPSMDYIPTSQKGVANGVASLTNEGKLPSDQLPDNVGSVKSVNGLTGKVVLYTYGNEDLEAGVSELATGKLHFVYE